MAALEAVGGVGDVYAFVEFFVLGGDLEGLGASFAVFLCHFGKYKLAVVSSYLKGESSAGKNSPHSPVSVMCAMSLGTSFSYSSLVYCLFRMQCFAFFVPTQPNCSRPPSIKEQYVMSRPPFTIMLQKRMLYAGRPMQAESMQSWSWAHPEMSYASFVSPGKLSTHFRSSPPYPSKQELQFLQFLIALPVEFSQRIWRECSRGYLYVKASNSF